MNIAITQGASAIEGLQELAPVTGTSSIGTSSLAAGASIDYSTALIFSRNDVISMVRVQLLGASSPIPNFWYPVQGSYTLQDNTAGLIYIFNVLSATNGRTLRLRVVNNTGASKTIPNLTINAYARIYSYPF